MDIITHYWNQLIEMYDLLLLGGVTCGAFILVGILYFLFGNNREEGDFERVYSPDALAILTEGDKKEKKGKNKNNKKKQRTPEATEDEREKQQSQKTSEAAAPASSPAPAPATPPAPVKSVTTVQSAPKPAQEKKTTPKQQPQQPQQQTESPKEEKKKPVKIVNAKDLDQKKVLSRLSAVADLEEGYVQFLTTAFRDSDVQKNNLSSEVKSLQKKLQESATKLDKLQKEKTAVETREKQEQTQRTQLSSRVQALQTRETELARQVHNAQATLSSRNQEHTTEVQNLRSKNQQLDNEINSLRSNNIRASGQLKTAQQQIQQQQQQYQQLKKEIEQEREKEAAQKEVAKQKYAVLDKTVGDAEVMMANTGAKMAEMARQLKDLEKAKVDAEDALKHALTNQTKRDSNKDLETETLKEEKKKWLAEKELMTEKYTRLEELIKELNNDISEFHSYKEQQEKIVGELNQRDKSRVEELAKNKEQFEAKEEALLKEIAEGKQKLMEVKKTLDEEKARIVEIPKNSPEQEPVVEEVFELKKTNADLAAAPSTSGTSKDEENEKLKAENALLHSKHDELRQRNLTILEKTDAIPSLLVTERKRVVAEIGKLVKNQFEMFADQDAFHEWLGNSVSEIEKSLSAKTVATVVVSSVPVSSPTSVTKAPKAAAPVQQVPAGNEGECRKALQILVKKLDHLSELADKEERRHQEELAALMAERT